MQAQAFSVTALLQADMFCFCEEANSCVLHKLFLQLCRNHVNDESAFHVSLTTEIPVKMSLFWFQG